MSLNWRTNTNTCQSQSDNSSTNVNELLEPIHMQKLSTSIGYVYTQSLVFFKGDQVKDNIVLCK
jgi:hypothetical protein